MESARPFLDRAQELGQSKTETEIKQQAIRSHQTQLKLSRRRFLAYAARPERFLKLESCELTYTDGPIQGISRQARVLRVKLRLPIKLTGTADATLGCGSRFSRERALRAYEGSYSLFYSGSFRRPYV
jgi:hypothetical protein